MTDPVGDVIVPEIVDEYCLRFWDGLREEQLYIGLCGACGRFHFYPRVRCPYCGSSNTDLAPASGDGTLISFTSVHRAPRPSVWGSPYVLGLVALQEGPRVLTAMDCTEAECDIGMAVCVVFRAIGSGDRTLWVHQFRPVSAEPTSQ